MNIKYEVYDVENYGLQQVWCTLHNIDMSGRNTWHKDNLTWNMTNVKKG